MTRGVGSPKGYAMDGRGILLRRNVWPYGPNLYEDMRRPLLEWAEARGVVQHERIGCLCDLVKNGIRRDRKHFLPDCAVSESRVGFDHPSTWRVVETGRLLLVVQNYGGVAPNVDPELFGVVRREPWYTFTHNMFEVTAR